MLKESKNRLLWIFGIIILVLAAFLYLYKLDIIPQGFYIDEASMGYNAYSILKTGKDEYGKAFPLLFRLYGAYTPPLFVYFVIPAISALGLNVFSVRFIPAITGVLSVLVFFYFLRSINPTKSRSLPYLGALLFAISPWIIFYSRIGYEVMPAFFLFSLGVLFVWRGLSKPFLMVIGLAIMSVSAYVGFSERFILPIFLLAFPLFFFRELKKRIFFVYFFWGAAIALAIQIPILRIINTPAFFSKINLFYNTPSLKEFASQFFTYFSPRSLFFLPDPDIQRSLPELSVFYPWMVIPYFFGIYFLWKKRQGLEFKFLLMLAIVSPIPAALAHDPFATHRALPLALVIASIISIGTAMIIKKSPKLFTGIFVALLVFSLILLWRSYFVLFPKERAKVWGYGVSQLAEEIKKNPDKTFVIDESRTKPTYISLAFFLSYPPEKLQEVADQSIKDNYYTKTSFNSNYKFANIETRGIDWERDVYRHLVLVGDEFAISDNQAKEHFLSKMFEIKDPLGNMVFIGYLTNPRLKCLKTSFRSPFCAAYNN